MRCRTVKRKEWTATSLQAARDSMCLKREGGVINMLLFCCMQYFQFLPELEVMFVCGQIQENLTRRFTGDCSLSQIGNIFNGILAFENSDQNKCTLLLGNPPISTIILAIFHTVVSAEKANRIPTTRRSKILATHSSKVLHLPGSSISQLNDRLPELIFRVTYKANIFQLMQNSLQLSMGRGVHHSRHV